MTKNNDGDDEDDGDYDLYTRVTARACEDINIV